MSRDPLATRLVLPHPAPDLIQRPALLRRLTDAVSRPLTLVAAPAGAGKTSLASSWARAGLAPGPVAWVSLDGERLTRPAFWTLVLESMQVALPDERPFRLPGSTDSALVAFMNRIAAQPRPVVLVLDDFHVVSDPEVMADLDVLLEHPLDALRLVILSRRDPPLRLVRLRVAGHMDELRARDLAFTEAEAAAFFRETVPALTDRDAGALLRRTEGWAAGLRMAVLTLRGHPDPRGFITDFAGTDSAVTDYLLTEVLDHQTECERTFLLRISLTDAVCGELADVLSGRCGCARQLQRLAGENAMLERVEGRPGWFRFHPLMRDLLRAELHAVAASELAGMHVAAARWFAERGWVRPATRHALAAGDRTLAATVVAGGWIELFLEGGAATLRSLVDLLPAEAIAAEPELSLAAAAAYIEDGQEVEAATAMRTALDGLDRVAPERRDQFRVAYAVVALRTARLHGDIAEGLQTARRMIGEEVPRVAAPGLHAIALATVGIAELWTGESARAAAHLETALGESERSGHRYVAALALAHLACMDSLQGRTLRADRRARAAVEIVEQYGWTRTSAAAAAYGVRSGIEFLWDDLERASRTLQDAADALDAAPERPLRAVIAANRVRVLAALGDPEAALASLRFEQLLLGDFEHRQLSAILRAQEGLLLDRLGEHDEARAVLRGAHAERQTPELAVALARLLLTDGVPEQALALVAPFTAGPTPDGLLSTRVQAHGVEALAYDALLDHDAAAAALRAGLDLAEPRGLRRMLSELGPALRPVVRRELRHETAHRAFVDELLEALDGTRTAAPAPGRPFEPLSERETTVLRFLPTMMSNQEIASELFVSVNTLKTHLKQIYRKLDVASRRDAVERGRAMGLLAPGAGLRGRG